MASAPASLGPVLPTRLDVWKQAHRIEALARRAKELAADGPHADLQLALQQLDAMRAVLGEASSTLRQAQAERVSVGQAEEGESGS